MIDENKATTTIPDSPAQNLIRTVDRRDKATRTAEIGILFALTIFNVFATVQMFQVISTNKQANIERQQEQTGYIKCVLLIRYDAPGSLNTRKGAEAALDACATKTQ